MQRGALDGILGSAELGDIDGIGGVTNLGELTLGSKKFSTRETDALADDLADEQEEVAAHRARLAE